MKNKTRNEAAHSWYVYILICSDDSYYTGVTTDMVRRLKEHNSDGSKTRYTRCRQPVILGFMEEVDSRSEALKKEYRIKQLSRKHKGALIAGYSHKEMTHHCNKL